MSPLTVTWPPNIYTTYGYENFKNLLKVGKLANISAKRNDGIMRLVTRLAVINLCTLSAFYARTENFSN